MACTAYAGVAEHGEDVDDQRQEAQGPEDRAHGAEDAFDDQAELLNEAPQAQDLESWHQTHDHAVHWLSGGAKVQDTGVQEAREQER
eukprot:CAMPEP_0175303852 /NCGR_PEP_ID=MMETSP0093-20121207/62926_1 /TAXON_ID=311494 /ORGANISM="Alexandrium monilatum, Strain CCMP3105" /LENGTH=86 /DNA_ID=CAMNT_0016600229 /DNA_START=1 /DNA_END=258 /DNA_ORIENTATION=-